MIAREQYDPSSYTFSWRMALTRVIIMKQCIYFVCANKVVDRVCLIGEDLMLH